jgi:hypothetical protein
MASHAASVVKIGQQLEIVLPSRTANLANIGFETTFEKLSVQNYHSKKYHVVSHKSLGPIKKGFNNH